MTVFVPQFNRETDRKDISDLSRYGEIKVVAWRYPYPDDEAPGREPLQNMYEALAGFNPVTDWLALVGSYVHIAAALFILGRMAVNSVRLLVYDRKFGGYYPVDLNTGDLDVRPDSDDQSNKVCAGA